ncbi:MAG: ATP-binding cassette domain-containing protein [Lachnospiraceae bacterium]|nr:ATP-binding cassette domain-containing protein [Lachnospiraceae bacterium]
MTLKLEELTKNYKDKAALCGITFSFTPGIYGLLGPNGAGKSTMMNLITDNLTPTKGRVLLDEKSIDEMGSEYRKLLGYMPQQQKIYPELSLRRFLYFMASLKGLKKSEAEKDINHYVRMVKLEDVLGKKLGTFSGGMKQRALIAQALIGNPGILIFDEPTAGLDPKERIRIRNLISEVARDKIVIIATHVVTDIEFIAKEIIMLNNGNIIRSGSPSELLSELGGKVWNIFLSDEEIDEINVKYKVSNISRDTEGVIARIIADSYEGRWKKEAVRPNLEDLYLYLNGD